MGLNKLVKSLLPNKPVSLQKNRKKAPISKFVKGSIRRKLKPNFKYQPSTIPAWPNTQSIIDSIAQLKLAEMQLFSHNVLTAKTTELRQVMGICASDIAMILDWLVVSWPFNKESIQLKPSPLIPIQNITPFSDRNYYFLSEYKGLLIDHIENLIQTCKNAHIKEILIFIKNIDLSHQHFGQNIFPKPNTACYQSLLENLKAQLNDKLVVQTEETA